MSEPAVQEAEPAPTLEKKRTVVNQAGMTYAMIPGRVPPHALTGTAIVKGTFSMAHGKPLELLEKQDWPCGDIHFEGEAGQAFYNTKNAESLKYPSDMALFKPQADLLLVGDCFTAEAKPETVCRVQFGVGSWSKALAVIGNRFWQAKLFGDRMSEAEPFVRMPLRHERAFGGPGFEINPYGRGHVSEQTLEGADRIRRLPNVEQPEALISASKDVPPPASFAPIPFFSPQRQGLAGTFGADYLERFWPWFPDDFDWRYYNAAPPDQRLAGFLRGDEQITLYNLHPQHALYRAWLPSLRARYFYNEQVDGELLFREAPLQLDTLWVDALAEQVTLIWRGIVPIRSLRMREITDLVVATEPLDSEPLPAAHYRQLLLDRKQAYKDKIAQADALTAPEIPPVREMVMAKVAELNAKREAKLAEGSKRAAALKKRVLRELSPRKKAKAEIKKKLGEQMVAAGLSPALLDAEPKPPPATAATARKYYQQARKALEAIAKKHPKTAPHLEAANLPAELPLAQELLDKLPVAEALEKGELPEKFQALKQRIAEGLAPVHALRKMKPPPCPPGKQPYDPWTREHVIVHAQYGGSFERQILEKLDLSGLDLRGCNFQKAILTEANLDGAHLGGANLTKALLGQASLRQANLEGAVCVKTHLMKADLTGATLTGADLTRVVCMDAILVGANLAGVNGARGNYFRANLTGANLTGGYFERAKMFLAILDDVEAPRANFQAAAINAARARRINLSECNLINLRASHGVDLRGARIVQALADHSNWSESNLEGADFAYTSLKAALFSDAVLDRASFYWTKMQQTQLMQTQLIGTRLVKANLFKARLNEANLSGADLSGSNLFEANFTDATVDGALFDLANLKRVIRLDIP